MNNTLDKYLQLIQKSFNINDRAIYGGIDILNNALKLSVEDLTPSLELQERVKQNYKQAEDIRNAIKIAEELQKNRLTLKTESDEQLINHFNDITMHVLNLGDINKVYRATSDIVDDLNNARNWIEEASRQVSELNKLKDALEIMEFANIENLTRIGKAILGRAIELTPYDTGYLRSQGTILVYTDYIVILFDAPYATYVHENMENKHPYGRAKFLEVALQEFFPDKRVWTEYHGENIVYVSISINGDIVYKH